VQEVNGVGRVHLDVGYKADGSPHLTHQVQVQIKDGHVVHRDLPLPLDAIEVTAAASTVKSRSTLPRPLWRRDRLGRLRLRPGAFAATGGSASASAPPVARNDPCRCRASNRCKRRSST